MTDPEGDTVACWNHDADRVEMLCEANDQDADITFNTKFRILNVEGWFLYPAIL